ncbi:nephronectin isoform 2-T2 [Rhynochetos jubatus]
MELALRLLLACCLALGAAGGLDGRWPRQIVSAGLCRFGSRVDCCWGWARLSWGQCQPLCQPGCKHGECVGPNKCKCHPGYTGKTCSQDIDECATGRVTCPRFRHCVNTFGSYICRCHKGFDLTYIGGKYQCHDVDECSLGHHQCGSFSRCYNTPGSYKCRCKEGYRDNGTNCIQRPVTRPTARPMPRPTTQPTPRPTARPTPRPTARPTPRPTARATPRPTARLTPKPTTRYVPVTTRPVTKPATRPPPPTPPQPTTLRPTLPPQRPPLVTTEEPSHVPVETTSSQGITDDNRIQLEPQKPRGDVFIPRQPGVSNNLFEILEIERGITADEFEANDDPGVLVHSCDFDSGLCGWTRENDDDLHWEPVRDVSGGQYLTISDPRGEGGRAAHLVLPLAHVAPHGDLCLSFRHKVQGQRGAALQVFVRKSGAHGPALWGRNGGHGWRQTHITLRGRGIQSVVFRGEKGQGRPGDIGLDDVTLRRGRCSEER